MSAFRETGYLLHAKYAVDKTKFISRLTKITGRKVRTEPLCKLYEKKLNLKCLKSTLTILITSLVLCRHWNICWVFCRERAA